MKFVEGRADVVWHGEVYGVILVVPVEGKAAVEATSPVSRDCVEIFEGAEEMAGVLLADIFDSKVVNDERARDRSGFVVPKTRGEVGRFVPVLVEVFFEALVGDDAGLWETVHALADFDVDPPILNKREEIVLIDDFLGDDED